MPKDVILGAPFEEFRKRLRGEMRACFQRPEHGRSSNRLVTDDTGRVFEARTYSENGVLDIVLNEVTDAQAAFGDLLRSTGTPIEKLTEEEIRILRQADRRFATVTVAQMRGLGGVAGRLPPHEVQLMLDAFAEEMSEAILATGSTVGQMTGDSVTGIFGSPRYHRDHALRAVTSACLQIDRIGQLHDAFSKQGRELPPCSIAIAHGRDAARRDRDQHPPRLQRARRDGRARDRAVAARKTGRSRAHRGHPQGNPRLPARWMGIRARGHRDRGGPERIPMGWRGGRGPAAFPAQGRLSYRPRRAVGCGAHRALLRLPLRDPGPRHRSRDIHPARGCGRSRSAPPSSWTRATSWSPRRRCSSANIASSRSWARAAWARSGGRRDRSRIRSRSRC